MDFNTAMKRLRTMSNQDWASKARYFGVESKNILGISNPKIRALAKEIGKDHLLAQQLWKSGVHEAMTLATLVDHPDHVTEEQMDDWIKDIDSWATCDSLCGNLFDKTPFAYSKAVEWTGREREYEKRAGFALIAYLAVHDKKSDDKRFLKFLPIIKEHAYDERNFVRKAVNWALREIGKRSVALNKAAIGTAKEIRASGRGKWVAADALRELQSDAVQRRLKAKKMR